MRRFALLFSILFLLSAPAALRATIFGSVRGIVHDSQHRPVKDAKVTLKAADSDYSQTKQSGNDGEFDFSAVPIGNYTVTVSRQEFSEQQQQLTVRSETSPVLHFELTLAGGAKGLFEKVSVDKVWTTPTGG